MRVFGRVLILAGLVGVVTPAVGYAAPIGLGDAACQFVASTECRQTTITNPLVLTEFGGAFDTFGDIALFKFELEDAAQLSVTTTSYAGGSFDPTLGLFRADGSIVVYDTAEGPSPVTSVPGGSGLRQSPPRVRHGPGRRAILFQVLTAPL